VVTRSVEMRLEEIVAELRSLENRDGREGQSRFGIKVDNALGISVTTLRGMARKIGKDHRLAQKLWKTGIHEARILASLVDDPSAVTEKQMESWAKEFDSWDVVDGCCGNLFDRTPFAHDKAIEWTARDEEFVKRAGFALMAYLAVHDKKAPDKDFEKLLKVIGERCDDDRNFVRKAANWALRQIGKRNQRLNELAIRKAEEIQAIGSRAARWIAADALRELRSEGVQRKLARP
jgi:3-methyladenine DNA glycosylase AlkD